MSQIEYFKLPISYLDNKCIIDDHINNDLNLISNNKDVNIESDTEELNAEELNPQSVYNTIFKDNINILGKQTIPLWSKYYTSNKKYIKDTQTLLKTDFTKTDISFNDFISFV